MGSYGEYSLYGEHMDAQREAQKKNMCDFFNSIDNNTAVQLKKIKQQYNSYYTFSDRNIIIINDKINKTNEELNSMFTFKQTTKDRLNNELRNLEAQLLDIHNSKALVDSVYNNYKNYHGNGSIKLSIAEFFSELSNCEYIVHTTAEVVDDPKNVQVVNAEVVNGKFNNNNMVEATRIRNKYLKYKQKYLNLKNKIN
jgi:hypothetical protein